MFGFPHFVLAKTQPAQDGRFWLLVCGRKDGECGVMCYNPTDRPLSFELYTQSVISVMDRYLRKDALIQECGKSDEL